MPSSRPPSSLPPRAPRVSLCPDEPGVIELALPADVSDETWNEAASDARGIVRLARGRARVLLDAQHSQHFARPVVWRMRAWMREVCPTGSASVALVLARPGQRLAARLLAIFTRRVRARVFGDRNAAVRWLSRRG